MAVFKVLHEAEQNRLQRETETSQRNGEWTWRKINLARELVEKTFDSGAKDALDLIDSAEYGRKFQRIPGKDKFVNLETITGALDFDKREPSPKEQWIRKRFEVLMFHCERLQ